MYGFALYALAKQFMLRRFAIVHEMGIGNFKGLIGAIGADLRKYLLKNRRTPLATTPTPNAATQMQNGWIMGGIPFLCITEA